MVNYDCKKRMNVIVNEEYAGGPTLGHRQCPPSSQVSLQVALPRQMTPGFSCAPQWPLLKKGENEVPLWRWRETLFPGLP